MPPSRMNLPRRRRFFESGGSTAAARAVRQSTNRFIVASQPWGGFVPDLANTQLDPSDATTVDGLTIRNGELRPDYGYEERGSSELPLGTATPPAASGSEEPVVGVLSYRAVDDEAIAQLAITADSTLGHVYFDSSGTWTNAAYTGTGAGITGSASAIIDWAYFPPDNFVLFCNGVDALYQYAQGTTYTEMNEGDNWTGGAGGDADTFGARSVEVAEERIITYNTIEGTTNFKTRVRWSTKGASATIDPADTGAGSLDLSEMGIGFRVLRLGPLLACYADTGVAFLLRTGRAEEAFQRNYISQTRGLLAPQAVVDIGGGKHFGLFADGWFILHSTGEWEEVGLRNINGKLYTKWRNNWYSNLNYDNKERIVAHYDERNGFVRIASPMGDNTANSEVWLYHIQSDTVWPDTTYPSGQVPNCWGGLDTSSTQSWASSTDTWAGTTAAWHTFASQVSRLSPSHGTVAGFVYRHDEGLVLRDGNAWAYEWNGPLLLAEGGDQKKALDKVHVGYVKTTSNDGSDAPDITTRMRTEEGTTTGTIEQTKGSDGTPQVDFTSTRKGANYIGSGITGTIPVRVREVTVEYEIEGDQETSSTP